MARDADGRVVFIEGALPGETVEVDIRDAKKDFAKATLVEIVERSPLRDAPSCSHRRAGCGGCDWMHLQPAAKLDAKVGIVEESLRRIGRLDADLVDQIFEVQVRDFSQYAVALHGKSSSTTEQQDWALAAVRRFGYFFYRTLQWDISALPRLVIFSPVLLLGLFAWAQGFSRGCAAAAAESDESGASS